MADRILVATQSFVVWEGGRMIRFRRGRTTIREGHPLLADHADRFRPLKVDFDLETEAISAPEPDAKPPAEELTGLARFAALKARAKELGLSVTGKADDFAEAIDAEERRLAAIEAAAAAGNG